MLTQGEAAITSLIWQHLNRSELAEPLSFLEMGHPKYGKIAMTKALGLTKTPDRRFLVELGKLRNLCAHRADNISFSFERYLAQLDRKQTDAFVEGLSYYYLTDDDGGYTISDRASVISNPKATILSGLKVLLAVTVLQSDTAKERRRNSELHARIVELYDKLRENVHRSPADS